MTREQHRLYTYMQAYMGEHGIAPSFVEMMAAMSLRSKNNVYQLLRGLERHGVIKRQPNRARAIDLVRHTCPHCGGVL